MKPILTLLALALLGSAPVLGAETDNSTRRERNLITEGNKLYRQERYADAEVAYKKALELNAMNETALFNLAASYLRQGSASGENLQEATQILNNLAKNAGDQAIAELSYFNLGNIAYNAKEYQKSIELYKNSLRKNPDNDKARENLRLAQKKLEEQHNQDQNQDQNQDKDQNKDQKDQNQNKDNNKDQNQDKNKDQDKDQNKDQNQQQQPDQKQQNQQQQPQQGGISPENAEQILKAMENEENATRQRVEAERRKAGAPGRRQVAKPW